MVSTCIIPNIRNLNFKLILSRAMSTNCVDFFSERSFIQLLIKQFGVIKDCSILLCLVIFIQIIAINSRAVYLETLNSSLLSPWKDLQKK